ncbi:ribulose-phosphate 3-epimerase [Magnetofaba australis]|uniref:Putative ribulose-phosphate 3-epimerase n=1 Tax=Magnetofaba australis IT-1 TaxID=1434232 RepID=A0A1Y2K4V2_9PROT|nr:ribulose-phosphate 3-epimerase [Magnetofaba australis]OSM04266.1 putative ribulose-phosphate 3-epimerase [Magnetofaba australis IT-1]
MHNNWAFSQLKQAAPNISAGIVSADFMHLAEATSELSAAGVAALHFDVMDGCFTPQMTGGPPWVKGIRHENMVKDVHLMIRDPLTRLPEYVAAGADVITLHAEMNGDLGSALDFIHGAQNANDSQRGVMCGLALFPETPLTALEKHLDQCQMLVLLAVDPRAGAKQPPLEMIAERARAARQLLNSADHETLLCVDGGVKVENIDAFAAMQPDLVVSGSALFKGGAPQQTAQTMLKGLARA